jgi:hypothetical protein
MFTQVHDDVIYIEELNRRIAPGGSGKILTTSVRRLISSFSRASIFVDFKCL